MIQLKKFTTDWPNCPKCGALSAVNGAIQYSAYPKESLSLRCLRCSYEIAEMPCADAGEPE